MNKYITKAIRTGLALSAVFFASANIAAASTFFIPAGATDITSTSATINSEVMNPNKNSYVWFEWSDSRSFSSPSIAGKQAFWGGRPFEATIEGLNPGTTYYYRAIVVARPVSGSPEAPIYSPVVSFKTLSADNAGGVSGLVYKTTQNNSSNTNNTNTTSNSTNTTTNNTTNTTNSTNSTNTNTSTTKNNTVRNTSAAATTKDGFTNTNTSANSGSASVVGADDSMYPITLIGWIALLIALFVVILIGRLIYEESEKRKKIREAKKAMTEAQTPKSPVMA